MAGLLFITDVHSLELETAQDMYATTAFYWIATARPANGQNDFSTKPGKMPTMTQAGTYSAVLTYLKAVQGASTDETAAVMATLKKTPVRPFAAYCQEA